MQLPELDLDAVREAAGQANYICPKCGEGFHNLGSLKFHEVGNEETPACGFHRCIPQGEEATRIKREIVRCDEEIRRCEAEVMSGTSDLSGVLLGYVDWQVERRILQHELARVTSTPPPASEGK